MSQPRDRQGKPVAEWIAGTAGLIITLALFGLIGWQAFSSENEPPRIVVEATSTVPAGNGFLVQFTARNLSSRTAAAVQVEGTLTRPGSQPVNSTVTLDYIPGNSQHNGGLYFPGDPATGELELRAQGYSEP